MPRLLAALAAIVMSFVALCNIAVFWHGAIFIAMLLPWAMGANRVFGWGRGN